MFKAYIIAALFIIGGINLSYSQQKNNNSIIKGKVTFEKETIPFVNIHIKGTTQGVLSDIDGNYKISTMSSGEITLVFSMVGYKSLEKTFLIKETEEFDFHAELQADVFGLDEVVITGDRTSQSRAESPVVVNSLSANLFDNTQSVTLSDGLNYCTGLRTENNCSNCGFTQVRMNGLEGPYSQILINSRPIFSGLAGVYGLELIPTNMIEKVEVVRGGGSALYGSNAVAGTINLILMDPFRNTFEAGYSSSLIGFGYKNPAFDNNISFNGSIVSGDYNTGMSIYGFNRERDAFDVNGDGFSNLAKISNFTMGARIFHRLNKTSKISLDYFTINEKRRGGDRFDYVEHEANIAESVRHKINTAALTYEKFVGKDDLFSVYASGQFIDRDSYYGANRSLKDYGFTTDRTFALGSQYKANFSSSSLVSGLEYTSSHLEDTKLGYRNFIDSTGEIEFVDNTIIANQQMHTLGVYSQWEYSIKKYKFTLGGRLDNYLIKDYQDVVEDKSGLVFSPRVNVMYSFLENLKTRISYSQGYRAPQIFDEDLHINTSGSRKVIFKNDPNLEEEKSYSVMGSLDYNTKIKKINMSLLLEAFYTQLNNPFANEYGEANEDNVVVYTRINSESGATIKGINTEINIVPMSDLRFSLGGTVQTSQYEEAQEFGEKKFFRSPNTYGYISADYDLGKKWCFSASGNYTGSMLVPYFGHNIGDPETGELREVQSFFDLSVKIKYTMKINKSIGLQIYGGVKNIFNSYQSDHDFGIDKDPGYIYGPGAPRTIYVGMKMGNVL